MTKHLILVLILCAVSVHAQDKKLSLHDNCVSLGLSLGPKLMTKFLDTATAPMLQTAGNAFHTCANKPGLTPGEINSYSVFEGVMSMELANRLADFIKRHNSSQLFLDEDGQGKR